MSRSLAAISKLFGQRMIENDYRLRGNTAVFCQAEAEAIDTGSPGQCCRRRAARNHSIGKPGAIHVQAQAEGISEIAVRGDFRGAVDSAGFSHVRQTDDRRLGIVYAMHRSDLHMCPHGIHIGLARRSRHTHQPRATGIKLYCRVLVVADVRAFVTINSAPRGR